MERTDTIATTQSSLFLPHLLENIGSISVEFTPEETKELNAAIAAIPIHGLRLPQGVLALSGVEAPEKK